MRKTKHKARGGGGAIAALYKLCEKFEAAKRDAASYDPSRRKKRKRRDPDPRRRRRRDPDPRLRRPRIRRATGPWYLSDPEFREPKTAKRIERYAPKHSRAAKKGWMKRKRGRGRDPEFREARTATRTKYYAPKHSRAAKKGWMKRRRDPDPRGMSYRRALALAG
jgi:hypothetical protein